MRMRTLAAIGLTWGLAGLALGGCSKQTELASEANAKYDRSDPVIAAPPVGAEIDTTPVAPPADQPLPDESGQPAPADAQPKTTPDTVTDYRASVAGQISGLPPVGDAAGLAQAFLTAKAQAEGSPGTYEQGAIPLGADERQYVPSDAELLAAEAGDRLSAALTGADDATKAAVATILPDPASRTYKRFEFRHSDVMGSGRYFYASPPRDASVPG